MTEGVNPKDLVGVRKAPLRLVPRALLIETAPVMALGAEKYGAYNWRRYPVKLSVYLEAIDRHLSAVLDGQWLDPESGRPHLAHVSACVGIILDARALGQLEEDWPPPAGDEQPLYGPASLLLAKLDNSGPARTTRPDEIQESFERVNQDAEVADGNATMDETYTAYEEAAK